MFGITKLIKAQVEAYVEVFALLTRHRQLTWEMTKREVTERYAGQVLGRGWAVVHPIILMGIYLFIFAVVLQQKVGGTEELPLNFPAYLLAGLVPWLAMQESLVKSSTAITTSASLVKQVVFPLEVLPVKTVLTSMISIGVSLTVLVVYVLVNYHKVHLTYLLLPLLVLMQLLWMIGLGYILAAVGAFIRDTKDLVQVGALVSMYLMPIFYLPTSVPELFRPILYLNPFSYLIWCYQDVLYFGRFEHWWTWIVAPMLALGFFGVGYRFFRRVKVMVGNVV
jgi:lipopolysaccharide transport system permease protein